MNSREDLEDKIRELENEAEEIKAIDTELIENARVNLKMVEAINNAISRLETKLKQERR